MASVERPAPSERAVDLRSELAAWRRAHPGATLVEIEQEVDRRLAGVRADKECGRRRQSHWMGGRWWDEVSMDCLAPEFASPVLGRDFAPDAPRP